MGRAADLNILHDSHHGIGLALPIVAGDSDGIPDLIAGPIDLLQRTACRADQDPISIQELLVVRRSL